MTLPHCVILVEIEYRSDIRMAELSQHLGFPLEPCEAFFGLSKRRRQDFDGHLPIELGVPRPIHFPHAALPQLGGDLVMKQRLSEHACDYASYRSQVEQLGQRTNHQPPPNSFRS